MWEIIQIFKALDALTPIQKSTKNHQTDCLLSSLYCFLSLPHIMPYLGWVRTSKSTEACTTFSMSWEHAIPQLFELDKDEIDHSFTLWLSQRPIEQGKRLSYSVGISYRSEKLKLVGIDLPFSVDEHLSVYEDFKAGAGNVMTGNRYACSSLILLYLEVDQQVYSESYPNETGY